jgi:hypothetical protein
VTESPTTLISGGALPLSWAQRAWLAGPPRLDEHDAWLHEIVMPMRVPIGFAPEQAVTMLDQLVRSYPALRSRLWRRPDGTIAQHVVDPNDPALPDRIRRLAVVVRDPDGGEPTDRPWRRDEPGVPNIALVLPTREPSDTTATIRLAHAFVDGGGLNALLSSFHHLIRSGVPPRPQDLLYRRIDFERSAAGAAMSAAAVRYLTQTASTAVQLDLVDTQRPVVKGEVPACMGTSHALFQLLARFGSGSRLLRASVLLCVAMLAYCGMRDRNGAWVAVNVANRMSADDKAFVGMTIQNGWLVHGFTPDVRFGDLVRAMAARTVECARHGRYDPDAATRKLDGAGLPRLPNFYFNYVEPPDARWRCGPEPITGTELDPRSRRFKWELQQAAGGGCPFEFNAFTASQSIGLILKYDDKIFTRADITRFIDLLRFVTVTVAGDPDVSVTGLLGKAGKRSPFTGAV